jgi:hypothetical protein
MTGTRQILFVQGGGAGPHDEWDDKLCDSLRRQMGGPARGPLSADARRGRPELRQVQRGRPS